MYASMRPLDRPGDHETRLSSWIDAASIWYSPSIPVTFSHRIPYQTFKACFERSRENDIKPMEMRKISEDVGSWVARTLRPDASMVT